MHVTDEVLCFFHCSFPSRHLHSSELSLGHVGCIQPGYDDESEGFRGSLGQVHLRRPVGGHDEHRLSRGNQHRLSHNRRFQVCRVPCNQGHQRRRRGFFFFFFFSQMVPGILKWHCAQILRNYSSSGIANSELLLDYGFAFEEVSEPSFLFLVAQLDTETLPAA